MVNKFIGEVAAPEFGDGFTIRLDMAGQGELETEFGDFEFVGKVQLGLAVLNAKYLAAFLKAALRGPDRGRVRQLPEIPTPIAPIGEKCLDAFSLFRYGKTHEQWVEDNAKEARRSKENPTKGTKA